MFLLLIKGEGTLHFYNLIIFREFIRMPVVIWYGPYDFNDNELDVYGFGLYALFGRTAR
jgi:hypothetical protein